MYHISLKTDKPDIGYMEQRVDMLMDRGIRISHCEKLRDYYVELRNTLYKNFSDKYGVKNPNSSKQLASFLEELSSKVSLSSKNDIINVCYDSENNKWSTKAQLLTILAELGYEFAQDLLDYRLSKKYAESIETVLKEMDSERLIHPKVDLTRTNRISYLKPALMNIPKKLLWSIVAPYKASNSLYSVDIKNQEPNILINMTNATELKKALETKDGLYENLFKQCFQPKVTANIIIDTFPENRQYRYEELNAVGTISPELYSAVKAPIESIYYNGKRVVALETICIGSEKGLAPSLPETINIELEDKTIESVKVNWEDYGTKYKRKTDYKVLGTLQGIEIEVTKAERNQFKRAFLALQYGASIFGIKEMCKTIDGTTVYNYITKVAEIKEYRGTIDKLSKQGINVIGTIFGTKVYAGGITESKKLKRVLLNLPIQGSGADILSLLIKHFYDYTQENDLTDKIMLYYTRHDELILEIDSLWEQEVGEDKVKSILRDMLEHQIDDWTPFQVEIEKIELDEMNIEFEYDEETA